VRRLTSHQAGLYGIPDRGRIAVGACADLLLFDPATVGISPLRRVNDLPGGGARTLRDPIGVHGVFVNDGVRVFDGQHYTHLDKGPGQVLDRFLPAIAASQARAAVSGRPPSQAVFREAAAAAAAAIDPIEDAQTNAQYRREVAGAMVYRALSQACAPDRRNRA
jgi:hypothetical protein